MTMTISQQSGSFGKQSSLFVRMRGLEDASKFATSASVIYCGRPVMQSTAVDANIGKILQANVNQLVYGLAKMNKNAYVDETSDTFGMYGSGKMCVVVSGLVDVTHNIYTATDGTETTVKTFDDTLTYAIGEPLYVAVVTGLITNVKVTAPGATRNDNTFLGYVTSVPSTTDLTLGIFLKKPYLG
jgi:hypothetical protein